MYTHIYISCCATDTITKCVETTTVHDDNEKSGLYKEKHSNVARATSNWGEGGWYGGNAYLMYFYEYIYVYIFLACSTYVCLIIFCLLSRSNTYKVFVICIHNMYTFNVTIHKRPHILSSKKYIYTTYTHHHHSSAFNGRRKVILSLC